MPRFVHATTGVTVEVSDETAANLSAAEWSPEKADEKPARRTSK
jgi:hypothetical protein